MRSEPVDALVLIAHGSRDPRWSAPIEALAAKVRAARPELAVYVAFLEHSTPDPASVLAQLADSTARAVAIAPLFLGIGTHARADIDRLINAACARHPHLRFTVLAAAGELPRVQQALASALLESIDQR